MMKIPSSSKKLPVIIRISLLFTILLLVVLPITKDVIRPTIVYSASIDELRKKEEAERARAERARQLKEQKERQAEIAKNEAEFLASQIENIKKQEDETASSIDSTLQEINQLKDNISVTEQKEAEEKRRALEAARYYFKERHKRSIDLVGGGELDIIMGERLSESSSNEAKFEAFQRLLRQRITNLVVAKIDLQDKKNLADGKHQQLVALKDEQTQLRRAKQSTQTKYVRLADMSETQAANYQKEMEQALAGAAYWEKKILAELTRIINARKSGDIPRTGASVGQRVRKGEVVGHQGNTGYSFGSHVHWEIRDDNVASNPRNYLSILGWPLNQFRITQEFGVTPYSKQLYSSGIHTGIDITQYDGANVYASCTGEIILDAVYGGYGRAFAHTCDNTDLVVLYGHLQSQ